MRLLLKATIKGGAHADLFAAPVQVRGYTTKDGAYVAPHESTRHKRADDAARLLIPTGAPRNQVQESKMPESVTIKQAGPYTVTSDGNAFYVNGKRVALSPGKSGFQFLLDTGCKGANGHPDFVGLTREQYALHCTFRDANRKPIPAPEPVSAEERARIAAERAFDAMFNEGGEGYNPHRFGSVPTYARKARRERHYPDHA